MQSRYLPWFPVTLFFCIDGCKRFRSDVHQRCFTANWSASHGESAERYHHGVYTLIIRSAHTRRVRAGRHLSVLLRRGLYLYTGSALGEGSTSLEGRIGRHLRRAKKGFWHIDRILTGRLARVVSVVSAETNGRVECRVNIALLKNPNTRPVSRGIGSSDCRCHSHLLAADGSLRLVQQEVKSCYAKLRLRPRVLTNPRGHELVQLSLQLHGVAQKATAGRTRTH
jgi:Uri superfamily endonuclease